MFMDGDNFLFVDVEFNFCINKCLTACVFIDPKQIEFFHYNGWLNQNFGC